MSFASRQTQMMRRMIVNTKTFRSQHPYAGCGNFKSSSAHRLKCGHDSMMPAVIHVCGEQTAPKRSAAKIYNLLERRSFITPPLIFSRVSDLIWSGKIASFRECTNWKWSTCQKWPAANHVSPSTNHITAAVSRQREEKSGRNWSSCAPIKENSSSFIEHYC